MLEKFSDYMMRATAFLFAALILVWAISWFYPNPRDATDPPNGRSGMKLTTDAETGCQYLSVAGGGITPRLDANGKQICKKDSFNE